MKKGLILLAVLGLAVTFGFADEYEQFNNALDNFDAATQETTGFGVRKLLQYTPVVTMAIGIGLAIYLGKQQANQQQDASKIFLTVILAVVGCTLCGIAIDAFIGAGLFQSAKEGLDIAKDEWLNAVGRGTPKQ
ncbi:MAG: hypothetical protein IJR18_07590 [Campylobacter sp.]|nr:hypothetical protein [Campylobacter sp.]